jgi:predicted CoA-binding protein
VLEPDRITLVLGASESTFRYSYAAANRLINHNEKIYLVGKKSGEIFEHKIHKEWPIDLDIHTLTLYVNPAHQKRYYQKIIDSNPKRVIFNPGTENTELTELLKENNIDFEYACTLVLLATGQY